uniref:Uncharacterized protein n=1 Tax=Myoviridae sp. ct4tH12 TaxID=2825031 RepID=A0A8S5PYT0_9CAUD|nr:MAG TPA: hypothetical protein [Myoviridae sp. ct4tH12]
MNDIEKKLEALKAEFLGKLEALQREAEMQKKQKEPKLGEKYFYISQSGKAILDTFTQHPTDIERKNLGNFFPTEERAEQVAKKMRLLLRLEQLHDMICPDYEPDWNSKEEKLCLFYNRWAGYWQGKKVWAFEEYPTAYFDTEENLIKAMEILEKELEESK